jgi:hypothetical protein
MNEMPLKGKGVYTKEMRIANLAKARLARGKKPKTVKGKGITSQATSAIGTASGRGITSQATSAIGTASGRGRKMKGGTYTQDYVPSDQLNYMGSPLDNLDYAKIRSRVVDKRKKGEYTYTKGMEAQEMPIPTMSGNGKNRLRKPMTYEENLVNDGYMPRMAMNLPQQYVRLMKGSGLTGRGWDDFVRVMRGAEQVTNVLHSGLEMNEAINSMNSRPNYNTINRPSTQAIPNHDYTQTSGLYEPINEGWEHVAEMPPDYQNLGYSDRPHRANENRDVFQSDPRPGPTPLYSDRPKRFFKEDRSVFDSVPKPTPTPTPISRPPSNRTTTFDDLITNTRPDEVYEHNPNINTDDIYEYNPDEPYSDRPKRFFKEDRSVIKQGRKEIAEDNRLWAEAEARLQNGREAKKDIYYQEPYDEIINANTKGNTQYPKYSDAEMEEMYADNRNRWAEVAREMQDEDMYEDNRNRWANEAREMQADTIRQNRRDRHRANRTAKQNQPQNTILLPNKTRDLEVYEASQRPIQPRTGVLADFTPSTRAEKQRANTNDDLNDIYPRVPYTRELKRAPYSGELKEKAPSILKKKKKTTDETKANKSLDERIANSASNRFSRGEQTRQETASRVSESMRRKAETNRKTREANALNKGRISEERLFKEHLQEPKGAPEKDIMKRSVGRPRKVQPNERLDKRLIQVGLKKKNVKEPIEREPKVAHRKSRY